MFSSSRGRRACGQAAGPGPGPGVCPSGRTQRHRTRSDAIGYLGRELGVSVPFSRRRIAMDVGNPALVPQLGDRPPEGLVLTNAELARRPPAFASFTQAG